MNVLCAFSSDSRELYKADIYRVLALPEGHVVHFRYKRKYVNHHLLNNPLALAGESVVIFYTYGNTPGASVRGNVSIRDAVVAHAEISEETDVFHVYLELKGFADVAIDSSASATSQPPLVFFSRQSCTRTKVREGWHSRVSAISQFFPDMTFFYIKKIENKKGSSVILRKRGWQSRLYELIHGDKYKISLAIANPNDSKTKIKISESTQEISIGSINPLESSIQYDDQDITLFINSLQVARQSSFLSFTPLKAGVAGGDLDSLLEYSTNIELNLRLSYWRPFIFGLLSTMAATALLLVQASSPDDLPISCGQYLAAVFLFFVSSGALFYWFDKK